MRYSDLGSCFSSRKALAKLCGLILIVVITVIAVPHVKGMFINVHPGEVGVLWKRFDGGTQTNKVYKDGLHIINPFNRMTVYKVNEQTHQHDFDVLSKHGLKVHIKISIRFTLLESNLPKLQKLIGVEYLDTLIFPEIESNTRAIFSGYSAEELVESQGSMIENKKVELLGQNAPKYLDFFDLSVSVIGVSGQNQHD